MGGGLMRLTPRYRRASLLGTQEGFKHGFQNGAKLEGQFGVILAILAALGPWAPNTFKNEAQNLPKSS